MKKIEFAPEFFETLPDDMSQEELEELMASIVKMFEEGTLEENSEPLTEEEYEALMASYKIPPEFH